MQKSSWSGMFEWRLGLRALVLLDPSDERSIVEPLSRPTIDRHAFLASKTLITPLPLQLCARCSLALPPVGEQRPGVQTKGTQGMQKKKGAILYIATPKASLKDEGDHASLFRA